MSDMISNDILCNTANFTPPMRASLFTLQAMNQSVTIAYVTKVPNFCRSVVAPNASPRVLSRMSWFINTIFYDSVCLKSPYVARRPTFWMQRLKIVTSRVWHHRVTWRRRWRHQSTRRRHFPMWSLLDTYPLNRLVSEILASVVMLISRKLNDLGKVADAQRDTPTKKVRSSQ